LPGLSTAGIGSAKARRSENGIATEAPEAEPVGLMLVELKTRRARKREWKEAKLEERYPPN
jgi:hypothetical protein